MVKNIYNVRNLEAETIAPPNICKISMNNVYYNLKYFSASCQKSAEDLMKKIDANSLLFGHQPLHNF